MRKLNVLAATALLATACFAGEKRVLTDAEKQIAYNVSVNYLRIMLAVGPNVTFQPVAEARFSTGIRNRIDVRFYMARKNDFGTVALTKFTCGVWPQLQVDPFCRVDGPYGAIIGHPFGR